MLIIYIIGFFYFVFSILLMCKIWIACEHIKILKKSFCKDIVLNNKYEHLDYTSVQSLDGFNIGDIISSEGKQYQIINIIKNADKPFVCKNTKGISIDHKYFDLAEIQKC